MHCVFSGGICITFFGGARGVVLGEIICKIEFSRGSDEVKVALIDSVFHPPVAHVKRLGEFLAHFGI